MTLKHTGKMDSNWTIAKYNKARTLHMIHGINRREVDQNMDK